MRFRILMITGLLIALLAVPAGASAAPSGRGDQYTDPFAAERQCKRVGLLNRKARGKNTYRVCVRALSSMQRNRRLSAKRACRAEPRKKVRVRGGKRRSPYGLCVTAGRRLRR